MPVQFRQSASSTLAAELFKSEGDKPVELAGTYSVFLN